MHPILVRLLNIIQLGIQLGFLWNEYIQLKDQKAAFFKSTYNWIDLTHFVCFFIYFLYRMYDADSTIPRRDDVEDFRSVQMQAFVTTLNILIILTATFKIMFYVRVYERIGWIVELIS